MRRLLIRPGAIGDCILSLPALRHLRVDYTEIWVPSVVVPLIRFADRVRSIAATSLDLLGLPDMEPPAVLLDELRSFDSIVSWYGANREDFRESVARLGLPFEFLAALPPADGSIHAADFFLMQAGGEPPAQPGMARLHNLAHFTGPAGDLAFLWRRAMPCGFSFTEKYPNSGAGGEPPAIPRIECPEQAVRDFAVIHPFSGSPRKNWPLDRYRELAGRLPWPVQWCAGPDEQFDGAVRIDNLYELGCWLAEARIYIGNDSGITHLAAACGARVVAIFGPTDPAIWAPRGNRVTIVSRNIDEIVAACNR